MSIDDLLAKLRADQRTTWVAGVAAALFAAGKALSMANLEPWGACVTGIGGFLALGALCFSTFYHKSPSAPDADASKSTGAPPNV